MKKVTLIAMAAILVALLSAPAAVYEEDFSRVGGCDAQIREATSPDGNATARAEARAIVNNYYPTKIVRVHGRTVYRTARQIRTVPGPVRYVPVASKPSVVNNFITPPAPPVEREKHMNPWAIWGMILGTIAFIAIIAGILNAQHNNGQNAAANAAASRIGTQRVNTGEADPPDPIGPSKGCARQIHYDHHGRVIYTRRDEWPATPPPAPQAPPQNPPPQGGINQPAVTMTREAWSDYQQTVRDGQQVVIEPAQPQPASS